MSTTKNDLDRDRIVLEPECAELSGLARSTRWQLERQGKFPRRRRLADKRVGWLYSELIAWMHGLPVGTVAQREGRRAS